MPRTREQNEALRLKRRQEIESKAFWLFAVKGFDNVKLEEISTLSGCSRALIYHYYGSVENLYNALIDERAASIRELLACLSLPPYADGISSLSRKLEAIINSPDVEMALLLRLLSMRHLSKARASLVRPDGLLRPLAEAIGKAQEEGKAKLWDPLELAAYYLDFLNGVTYRKITGNNRKWPAISLKIANRMIFLD